VLRALVGPENVAGPTLSNLASNFGLAPLIGKPLAIISDARLSRRTDQAAVVERLLSISGEDALDIDRKHLEFWTGKLPTRLVLISNELPRLDDASGALPGRMILLRFTKSFFGKEDPNLSRKLLAGLPGINMGQDSPEYKYTHHSAVDTFDKVKPDLLTRDATMMALTSYWIADRPERLASPWPPEKTAKMLIDKHNDVFLKAAGIWPFGDLGSHADATEPAGGGKGDK